MTLPINAKTALTAAAEVNTKSLTAYNVANAIKTACIAGELRLHDLVASKLQMLISIQTALAALKDVPGVAQAYTTSFPHKTTNFAVDALAFHTALGVLIDFIVTQIPKNGDYLNTLEFGVGNQLVQRTVTNAGSLATMQAEAQKLLDLADTT